MPNMHLFLAIAAARDLELCQLDIDNAFLYAPIKEDAYIRQPLGFNDGTSKVCHLKRCLIAYTALSNPPASSTCSSVHGSSTMGGNNAFMTRSPTSSAHVTSSP
jgi:hypothetical protein